MNGVICSIGTSGRHVTLARIDEGIRITVRDGSEATMTVVNKAGAEAIMLALRKALEGWE